MTASLSTKLLEVSAELITSAKKTVALTGAGISTPSGIPDFRSNSSGLWENFDPISVASLLSFRYQPEDFFKWVRPLVRNILSARPNPAHIALARLEDAGLLAGVITQNIDDLHRRAGSKHLYEIHGHLRQATCISCYRKVAAGDVLKNFADTGLVPYCELCGGLLKPDVVLIGEQLPHEIVSEAMKLLEDCDLIIVAGSSMRVTPACTFPIKPLDEGAHMVIINNDPTYLDERADVVFREDIAEVLPRLANEVLGYSTR